MDGLGRLVRARLRPQHLDELLRRDGLVAVEQERGQELSRLAAADRQRLTVEARHERAEKAELDAVDKEVLRLIDDAVAAAKAAPLPSPEELLTDVYVAY